MSTIEDRLLDTAESLFYAKGVQGVGMAELREQAQVPLKRIYQLHSGKDEIVLTYLRRLHERWHASLAAYVEPIEDPRERVLAVFDWLHEWFATPGFRGDAWVNAFGELGGTTPAIAEAAKRHKQDFDRQLSRLVRGAGGSRATARAIFLLAEGAIVTAAIDGSPKAAKDARRAAELLLDNG